jgi:two-component system, NtrC family, sensor histidine kinase PilS
LQWSPLVINPRSLQRLRLASRASDPALKLILDPRRLLRWVFVGRLCLASAIFIAAVSNWSDSDADRTLVASLAFALSTAVTVLATGYVEIYRRRIGPTFLYLQATFDLLLVTSVVHVTGGVTSPFAALYILVSATASFLLPAGGGLLIAGLGIALYVADVVAFLPSPLPDVDAVVWLQLGIIAIVALVVRKLSAQMRESGEGKDLLLVELEQTKLQAEDILRNIRSGVVTVDVDGRLLYANPMSEQLLGIDLVDRIGEPILDDVEGVAPEIAQAVRRAAQAKMRTTRGEGFVSSIAKRFPVGVTTTYTEHDDTGRGRTATAIFQDISDQKRLESLKLRAERLEGIAELSASLAHEIRNPLASIRSSVEQISRMPAVSDDQKTLTALVMRESDRLSRLLAEFLDFARVRVARTDAVDLTSVVRGAASLVAAHPDKAASVTVVCVVSNDETIDIIGDEDLLHRAIFNLALNAVQAAPANTDVRIELARGTAEALPAGLAFDAEAVSLRVSDAGHGIAPEIRDRMFDPFFTTKANGNGLGLAVVHRAIEAHRGHILVDSSARGTTFTVVLPRAGKREQGSGDAPLAPGAGRPVEHLATVSD